VPCLKSSQELPCRSQGYRPLEKFPGDPGAGYSALGLGGMAFRALSFFSVHIQVYRRNPLTIQSHCAKKLCPLYAFNHFVCPRSTELAQVHRDGLGPIASSLSNAGKTAKRTLRSVRLSPSAALESVKPAHYSFILKAEVKFSENRASCVEFFRECVRYGKNVVMTCTVFVAHSSFSRSRSSQDLVDDAASLGTERTEVLAETAVQPQGASLHITGHSR